MNFTGEQGRVHIPSPYVNSRVTSQGKRSTIVFYEKNKTPKNKNIIVSLRDRHRSVPAVQLDLRARLLRILSLLKDDPSRHKLLFGMMGFFSPFFHKLTRNILRGWQHAEMNGVRVFQGNFGGNEERCLFHTCVEYS